MHQFHVNPTTFANSTAALFVCDAAHTAALAVTVRRVLQSVAAPVVKFTLKERLCYPSHLISFDRISYELGAL